MEKTTEPKSGYYWLLLCRRRIVQVAGKNYYFCGDSQPHAVDGNIIFYGPIPEPPTGEVCLLHKLLP